MVLTPLARRRARYAVPVGAAAIIAAIVVVPQAASGAQHPTLPARTAAQLLASLEHATLPQFSGTTVETARLGLPSISGDQLPAGVTPSGQSQLMQIVTLLTGSHTTQIAYGGPDRQRVAIFLSDLSETDIVHNGDNVWTYSSDSNAVTHNTLRHGSEPSTTKPTTRPTAKPTALDSMTAVNPTKAAQQALAEIDPSTKVRVDRTAKVAGRPAYQVDLNPRDPRTLISSVRIALDAKTSMPLRVQIWSRTNHTSPAFSVGFTSLTMSAPNPSTFDFSKPPSATMAPGVLPGGGFGETPPHTAGTASSSAHGSGVTTIGKDWTTVAVARLHDAAAAGPAGSALIPKAPNGRAPAAARPLAGGGGTGIAPELDQLGTRVAAGHLLTTSLLSILITNDNRILIGAVTPHTIERLATTKAAQ